MVPLEHSPMAHCLIYSTAQYEESGIFQPDMPAHHEPHKDSRLGSNQTWMGVEASC